MIVNPLELYVALLLLHKHLVLYMIVFECVSMCVSVCLIICVYECEFEKDCIISFLSNHQ